MRPILLLSVLSPLYAAAQFPLPFWEAFDSTRVVLAKLPSNEQWPDTLWANGHIPVPIIGFDTVVVDQCCLDNDPPILIARVANWPKDTAGDQLPLFTERLHADTAVWFRMGEWRNEPDTMIPLTAHPNSLVRYFRNADGPVSQTDHYGNWQSNYQYHSKREANTVEARDSLKIMRCTPHSSYRSIEPDMLLLFVHDSLIDVFHDNRATGIDGWGYFDRAARSTVITARSGQQEAIVISSGEVLVRTPERWKLLYREPSIYRGECDCQ